MTTKKEEGWERQARVDSELASDTSKDKNMMDFCDYFDTGKAYITLAGFMSIANEEGFTSEVHEITMDAHKIHAIMKVTNKDGDSMISGRTEYHMGRDGKPDQHALAKAINIATKNAVKQLLYGHPKAKEMLDDFQKNNKFEPPPQPKQEPKSNPKQATETKTKTEPEPEPETKTDLSNTDSDLTNNRNGDSNKEKKQEAKSHKEIALSWYSSRLEELTSINEHTDRSPKEVLEDWLIYFVVTTPDKMGDEEYQRVTDELKKQDLGLIGKFFKKPPTDMAEVIESHRGFLKEATVTEDSEGSSDSEPNPKF